MMIWIALITLELALAVCVGAFLRLSGVGHEG